MQIKINIASKRDETVFDAPSVVSLITKEEIANLNPRTISELLNIIPGFNLHTSNLGSPLFHYRGIHSVNDQILLLIDGHPVNDRMFGTIVYILNSIPVEEIERLEIIRGPGSAIYGTNAFYAVINIVTKSESGKNIRQINSKFGSDNALEGKMVINEQFKDANLFVSGSISYIEGPHLDFKDRTGNVGQTNYEEGHKHLYLRFDNGAMGIKALYNQQKLGPFAGIAYYLSDRTLRNYTTLALETYSEIALNYIWTIRNKLYWDSFIYDCYWEYVPPSLSPPNGYITDAYAKDYKLGFEITAEANFNEKHRLLIGALNDFIGLTDSRAMNNLPDFGYQFFEVPGSWISNSRDRNYAVYFQDNYFLTEKFQIVTGIRYDNHTAYGSSWNPRSGITYKFSEGGHAKLLYGQAFRAPNNWDLYGNSSDQINNPDLSPEKIQTTEAEILYVLNKNFVSRINAYHNEISDLILKSIIIVDENETSTKDNLGKIEVNGIEAELRGSFFSNKHKFNFNMFYNKSRDTYINLDMYNIPNWGANFYTDHRWKDYINTSFQLKHISEIIRNEEDNRFALPATTTMNFVGSFFLKQYTIKAGIYNLTNEKVYTASPYNLNIDDFPHIGRNYMLTIEFKK